MHTKLSLWQFICFIDIPQNFCSCVTNTAHIIFENPSFWYFFGCLEPFLQKPFLYTYFYINSDIILHIILNIFLHVSMYDLKFWIYIILHLKLNYCYKIGFICQIKLFHNNVNVFSNIMSAHWQRFNPNLILGIISPLKKFR